MADAALIELVATGLVEAEDSPTWSDEQYFCVATKLAEHTDAALLRAQFLQGAPPPGPEWSEAEATSFVDALYECTPQAEVPIAVLAGLDPSKESCIRDAFDVPKAKALLVANLMGADGLAAGMTGEMERVRELCGVPTSRVVYGGEDTIPLPFPVDECAQAESVLIDAVDAWYETHEATDHPSGPELVEAGLLAVYDATLFTILEGRGPEPSYVLPTLACAD